MPLMPPKIDHPQACEIETFRPIIHQKPTIYDYVMQAPYKDRPAPAKRTKSQRAPVLTVPAVHKLVKGWRGEINLKGNYGSHMLRKTWGYHQRVTFGMDLSRLMVCFNHSTQRQTFARLFHENFSPFGRVAFAHLPRYQGGCGTRSTATSLNALQMKLPAASCGVSRGITA